ncbi:MAG: permease [Verrucomicrobia bacterium]|nr:permease [Verrucomicrobiota bacterium]
MKTSFDILGLGVTAVDELLFVSDFPSADAKRRVLRRERHCGGLTSTALVAASRLGAKCAYAGVLGEDEGSAFVRERLRAEGVDVTHAVWRTGARPVRSTIVIGEDHKTRNIFFDISGVVGADARKPSEKLIRSARVLFVDMYGLDGMIRAAKIARAAGIPVVGDFERSDVPRFRELFDLVDHLIVPADFACKFTGARTPAEAVTRLWNKRRKVVVVTSGERGCYFVEAARTKATHLPAFKVEVVDTTGCGDVFHGAYAAALARGVELEERLRFAAAAAALKATRPGGQAGIPNRSQVEGFLRAELRKSKSASIRKAD